MLVVTFSWIEVLLVVVGNHLDPKILAKGRLCDSTFSVQLDLPAVGYILAMAMN